MCKKVAKSFGGFRNISYLCPRVEHQTSNIMVNQKQICFKIDLENLEDVDDYVREASSWTTRNRVLNNAIQFYLEYIRAKNSYNYEGDPAKIREFISKYMAREPARLFT